MSRFVRRVLADTEDVWERVFQAAGKRYEKPTLVLFSRRHADRLRHGRSRRWGRSTARSTARSTSTSTFYRGAEGRFGAPGDFAQAYVIAHEVGHHVQKLLGVADKVQAPSSSSARDERARQRAAGAHGAAGRLPGRRVGQPQRPGEAAASSPATSRRASTPRRRSATTRCSGARRATWCRSPSRTARRSSACAGSSAASRAAR